MPDGGRRDERKEAMREDSLRRLERLGALPPGSAFFWVENGLCHHGYLLQQSQYSETEDVEVIERDEDQNVLFLGSNLQVSIDLTAEELAIWWLSASQFERLVGMEPSQHAIFGADGAMRRVAVGTLPIGSVLLKYMGEVWERGYLHAHVNDGCCLVQFEEADGEEQFSNLITMPEHEQVVLEMLPTEIAQLYMEAQYLSVASHPPRGNTKHKE